MAEVTRGFLNASIDGLDAFVSDLASIKPRLSAAIAEGVKDIGNDVVASAQSYCPVKDGTLRDSIQVRNFQSSDYGASCDVGPDETLPYVFQREFGGIITAKNAPYLVFRTYDGAWHRCKSVNQPAHPYMAPAWRELNQQGAYYKLAQRVFQVFE